ncbi:hypothetical protein [Fodinibius roseus]|uniref:hypothetical protein n=1 Tax=Fodinibius roseus TaxID=1194090 RepID=UPI0009344470|nr:hypothetical protein [Fodinibius roseus]
MKACAGRLQVLAVGTEQVLFGIQSLLYLYAAHPSAFWIERMRVQGGRSIRDFGKRYREIPAK